MEHFRDTRKLCSKNLVSFLLIGTLPTRRLFQKGRHVNFLGSITCSSQGDSSELIEKKKEKKKSKMADKGEMLVININKN